MGSHHLAVKALFTIFLLSLYSYQVTAEQIVPSKFSHNKIFVSPTTHSGVKLYFHTDTGGGGNVLEKNKNTELIIDENLIQLSEGYDEIYKTIPIPRWQKGSNFPLVQYTKDNNFLLLEKGNWASSGEDGQLGNTWFAGKIWKFDYINEILSVLTTKEENQYKLKEHSNTINLTFKTDSYGERVNNFPRMFITVDQQKLPVLLDTGATTFIADKEINTANSSVSFVAASFITESIFRQWQKKHPNWHTKFEEYQRMRFEMIKVPSIDIAGFKTGPVWFTMRPDENFHQWLSPMMSGHVEGAIGGSAFQYFSMVINYPKAEASFSQPLKNTK